MAEYRKLLRSQKNAVLEAIVANGMDANDFEWNVLASDSASFRDLLVDVISHKKSGYFYKFDFHQYRSGVGHMSVLSPGKEHEKETRAPGNWELQLQYFKEWLNYLKCETRVPDYWAQLTGQAVSVSPALEGATSQETFTDEEKAQLSAALNRIKHHIQESSDLTEGQLAFVTREIVYLKESSDRLTKKDWILLAIGGIINIATQLGLSAPIVHKLFGYLREGLGGAIQFLSG